MPSNEDILFNHHDVLRLCSDAHYVLATDAALNVPQPTSQQNQPPSLVLVLTVTGSDADDCK